MSSRKFKVKKFNENKEFSLWQMKDLLIQRGVHKASLGKANKPEKMTDDQWVDMDEKMASSIQLNLDNEVIHNMINIDITKAV